MIQSNKENIRYVVRAFKMLYVIDLPQKSPLCSDELFECPFSHRKLFCYPVAMNNSCI